MCEASMRAQKFLFGALVTAAQQTGDCAQNGGYTRCCNPVVDHAV